MRRPVGRRGVGILATRFRIPKEAASLICVAAACFALLVTSVNLRAQSYYGSIRGILHDASGAVVPNAKLTLIDELTNLSRSTISNEDGVYVFNQVVPSTFTIVAEAPGFNRLERKGLIISTQSNLSLDLTLTLGKVTETVEVTAAAPLIENASASQGQVLNHQAVTDLPNIGRDAFILARIANNIVPAGNPSYVAGSAYSTVGLITVAGGMLWQNLYTLDGIPITTWFGTPMIIPSQEAVEEMKLQTNTYDAEVGRTGGGIFNTTMKGGTNNLHGSAYGSLRRNFMDANLFFNNAAGRKLTPLPNNTWAGSIGGPVYIPHLYDGRNRTFFFLAYEGYDDTQAYSTQYYVPTSAEKQGDFSQSKANGGAPLVIYDPATTVHNLDGSYTRMSFADEYGSMVIPTDRLNTVGKNIASYYAPPQTTPAYYGSPDVTASTSATTPMRQYLGKIDEQITSKWRATLTSILNWSNTAGPNYFGGVAATQQWIYRRHTDGTSINNVITLSPSTVLAARYGFNRFSSIYDIRSVGFDPGTLGFPDALVSQIKGLGFPIIAGSTVLAGDNLSGGKGALDNYTNNVASVILSSTRGRHSMKAGFDFRRLVTNAYAGNQTVSFSFNGVFSQSTPANHVAGTGADLADLLLGYPSAGSDYRALGLNDYTHYYALYGQDDFRVSNRLTITMGLRWERENGLRESQNRLIVDFDKQATNPLAANVTGIVPKGVMVYAGEGAAHTYVGNPNLSKFAPRLGFAYQINHKTVVRGGFGIIWAPQESPGGPLSPPTYAATTPYVASNDGNATPANSLSNPFPNGLIEPLGRSVGHLTGVGQNVSLWTPWATSPRIEQYSVDLQRELPGGIALEIGYLGTRGTHLTGSNAGIDLNQNVLDPGYFSLGSALKNAVPNPFYGNGGVGIIGGPTVPAAQLLLPFPEFGAVTFQSTDLNHSRYDSLIVKGEKRIGYGLTFLSTLTWGRSYDLGSTGNVVMPGASGVQNPFDVGAEWAPSNWQPPINASIAFSYELPAGKGKWLFNRNAVANYVLGGWQVNAVGVFRSGFNIGISQAVNNNGPFGYAAQRPNATGTSPETSGSLESRLGNYINPAAFSSAPAFTFGNVSRYIPMRGPGMSSWDMSLFKTVPVYERLKAQFRVEALNAFNTPEFNGPNSSFGSGAFGHITSQGNLSREMQLAIRLIW